MKRIFFFFILLGWQFCLAQNQYIVLAENGINIRELPNRNSKILGKISYGEVVNSTVDFYSIYVKVNSPGVNDTIDSVIGQWIDVHYLDISGYAFSPYLYIFNSTFKIDTLTGDSSIKLTREGYFVGNCVFLYHPKLNWYGIYQDSNGFSLQKVDLNLTLSKVVGLDKFQDQNCLMPELPEGILLTSNRNTQSLFLIASAKNLIEGGIDSPFYNYNIEYDSDKGFLYPEQVLDIGFNKCNYSFRASDSVSQDNQGNIIKKYQLELIKSYYTGHGEISEVLNISEPLKLFGTGRDHSYYKTPKIYWTGDINKDGLLDFIIHQHGMAGNGGVEWIYTLFLSCNDNPDKLLYKIAEHVCWGCN